MEREERFINLVQTILLLRSEERWINETGWIVKESEMIRCLDDSYYFARKESASIMTLELNTLAISYVNNWFNKSPGFRKNLDVE